MKRASTSFRAGTPLSTQDVTRLAGTSRRVLDRYEQTGLLVPKRPSSSVKAKKQWSVEQAKITDYIRILQHGDRSIESIATLSDEGAGAFLDTVQAQCAHDIREARRQMKAAIKDARRCTRAETIGVREGMYLRSFPQRWLALAPVPKESDALPDPSGLARLYIDLYSVAHVVGWAPTGATGVLASISEGPRDGLSAYAYIELASPPLPVPGDGTLLDTGCYHCFTERGSRYACCGECERCAHFGREPTTEELFRWNAAESEYPRQWDHVLMAADMPRPYPYGIWSDDAAPQDDALSLAAFRPRLMPHDVRLPLGITACSMPEGAYLCSQCDEDEESETYQRLMGATLAIPRKRLTDAEERVLCERFVARARAEKREMRRDTSFRPLFSQTGVTTTAARAWRRDVGLDELHKLVIPVNAALPPQEGFCVTCSTLQTGGRNDVPRLELRLLVDAAYIVAEQDRVFYDDPWQ